MSYEEALRLASRDERFKATVYAVNSLLICKGVYTHQEFQQVFTEWVEKEQQKNAQMQELTSRASHA
jgi:prenyltransferase beta subunit